MYSNHIQSQANPLAFTKNPVIPLPIILHNQKTNHGISTKSLITDPGVLTKKRRGFGNAILDYILSYRSKEVITLLNSTIAKAVGCDTRTVREWTTLFVKEGIMLKWQHVEYGANVYTLLIDKSASYNYWLQRLSPEDFELYRLHGTTTQKELKKEQSLLPTRSYIYINTRSYNQSNTTATGPAKKEVNAKEVYVSQKERALSAWFAHEQYRRVVRSIKMLGEEQRKFIERNQHNPDMKSILSSQDKLGNELFSPIMNKIADLLELTLSEKIKLIAFNDEMLSEVYTKGERIKNGLQGIKNDRVAWLYWELGELAKKANLRPDWHWYYLVAKILEIDTTAQSEPRPFGSAKPRSNPIAFGMQGPPVKSSVERQAEHAARQAEIKSKRTREIIESEMAIAAQEIIAMKALMDDPKRIMFGGPGYGESLILQQSSNLDRLKQELSQLNQKDTYDQ